MLASAYGIPSRLLHNNDVIVLSLLLAAQKQDLNYTLSPPSCHPLRKNARTDPEFYYPAAISMITSGVGFTDDIHDEHSLKAKLHNLVYQNKITKASHNLSTLHCHLPSIKDIIVSQQHLEESPEEPLSYTKLTAHLYGIVFAHTSILSGTPGNYTSLYNIGTEIGTITYILDHYLDRKEDDTTGSFNLFNNSTKQGKNLDANDEILSFINQRIDHISAHLYSLTLHRYKDILFSLFTTGLRQRIHRIITKKMTMRTRPISYTIFTPLFPLVLLQSDPGLECCSCSTCSPETMCVPAAEEAIAAHIATSVATGAVIATAGVAASSIISSFLSNTMSGTSSQTFQAPEATMDTSPQKTDTPQIKPDMEFTQNVKKHFPKDVPKDFPLFHYEHNTLGMNDHNPDIEGYDTFIKMAKARTKHMIREDHQLEVERKEKNISLQEEGKQLWDSRPPLIDTYYKEFCKHTKIPYDMIISDNNILRGLAEEIEEEILESGIKKTIEWLRRFNSYNRRRKRFNQKPLGNVTRQDAQEYSTVTAVRG